MTICDWRDIPAPAMAGLYHREESRWATALGWDMASSWATVEAARATWGLPGLVCVSAAGDIRGWTFYLAGESGLDIGGLSADSEETTTALVDALITRAGSVRRLRGLCYAAAPAMLRILTTRGAGFVRWSYRRRAIDNRPIPIASRYDTGLVGAGLDIAPWSASEHLDATAALLHRAYEDRDSPIGRDITAAAWADYLRKLLLHDGCGAFRHDLSRVLHVGGTVCGVALVSAISVETVHLVQLAVDPMAQRGGCGRALLAQTIAGARAAGMTSMSLLVSEDNRAALRLYRHAGFIERGVFVRLGSGREEALDGARVSRIA